MTKEESKLYHSKNKDNLEYLEKKRQNSKNWYEKNREYILKKHQKNKEIDNERDRKWHEKNKNIINNKKKEYYKTLSKNKKELRNKLIREYRKEKYKTNYFFKLTCIVRSNIITNLKINHYNKKLKTNKLIGCTFEELKTYLESKFEIWMNWENCGLYNGQLNYGWDIDHITPLSSAKTEEELLKLFHYTNLQPLCGYTNRYIKKDNIEENR